jgi:hypothetical protein
MNVSSAGLSLKVISLERMLLLELSVESPKTPECSVTDYLANWMQYTLLAAVRGTRHLKAHCYAQSPK